MSRWLSRVARSPGVWVTLVAMALTWFFARDISARYQVNVVDDSVISMQYARNVAHGHGVVFNVGERVEGYTNFLWVMVMAALYRGCEALHVEFMPAVITLSIALAMTSIGLVYVAGRKLFGGTVAAVATATGLLVVDGGYQMWAAMALEGHLLAVCFVASVAIALYRPRRWPIWLGLTLALGQMTRPDAALFSASLLGSLGLEALLARGRGAKLERARELAVCTAVLVGIFGTYFVWRYRYYGFLHPNTYYLKVSGSKLDAWDRGLEYVKAFLEERAYWPALTALAFVHVREPVARALVFYLAGHVLYQLYVGGDFYPGHRFFIGQLPLFALLAGLLAHGMEARSGALLARVFRLGSPLPRYATSGGVLIGLLWLVREERAIAEERGPIVEEVVRWSEAQDVNRSFCLWLGAREPQGTVFATGDIGSAGFFANAHVIDIYGVIDPVVAHRDVAYFGKGKAGHEKQATTAEVLAKRPELIKLGYLDGDLNTKGYFLDTSMPPELAVEGIWRRDRLSEHGYFLKESALSFEAGASGWRAEGTAFQRFPVTGRIEGQGNVWGHAGAYANTFHPSLGDAAKGKLTSAPIPLVGDRMVVRVGGGYDPDKLHVSLVVGGVKRFSETGRNTEVLGRKEWDISPYKGQTATVQIVDQADGPWGHILVDEIAQWSADHSQLPR